MALSSFPLAPSGPGESIPAPTCDLAAWLLGPTVAPLALPDIAEIADALIALASGARTKALLSISEAPLELALVRRDDSLLVSYYSTDATPTVFVVDRFISLPSALERVSDALARGAGSVATESIRARLAERARSTSLAEIQDGARPVAIAGGVHRPPPATAPLAFGFSATVHPSPLRTADAGARADIHATLFPGILWVYARGHRLPLVRGPILLAVQRMVCATRALVEAWDAERAVNVRLRSSGFAIGVRRTREGDVSLTLSSDDGTITVGSLDTPEATLPVLRLASELLRVLGSADRAQARNLRIRALRDEVRTLRRHIRERTRSDAFVNANPDRLRIGAADTTPGSRRPQPSRTGPSPNRLNFSERWSLELDEVDAASTFLCGDRLVIATPRRALALARDTGDVLWVREGLGGPSWMAGRVLVRRSAEGRVELCHVDHGEPYATAKLAPSSLAGATAVHAAGAGIPPTLVACESTQRLVALDLQTGEPRWRFNTRAPVHVSRSGRVLLAVTGDGSLSALDIVTGEVAWRFRDQVRLRRAPAVVQDRVIAIAGEPGSATCRVYGIDLYSGELHWRQELDAGPTSSPLAVDGDVVIALGPFSNPPPGLRVGRTRGALACLSPVDGSVRWFAPDPGIGGGAAAMTVDRTLVVNAPRGVVRCLDLANGAERWRRDLADPSSHEVPRRLEPVLRGGALFVPSSGVHVLRPHDGASIGRPIPSELVPDVIRVDERGWVFIAEESGLLSAFAPVARLTLVHGAASPA